MIAIPAIGVCTLVYSLAALAQSGRVVRFILPNATGSGVDAITLGGLRSRYGDR